MKKKGLLGSTLLLIASMIWGCAFVVQSVGTEYVQPITFNGIRLMLGGIVLLPMMLTRTALAKRRETYEKPDKSSRRTLIIGSVLCGTVFCFSSCLQQIGISAGTASGKAGFISAFYILLVPLCGLFMKKRVRPMIWICIAVAMVGLYVLCVTDGFSVATSDIYMLVSTFGFTAYILLTAHFAPLVDGVKLSCIQYLVAGGLGIVFMFLTESPQIGTILSAWPLILYAGVLSCGVANTLQTIAQSQIQPAVASLIMSMESVFAVLAGIVFLNQLPSARELSGCALMLVAIIVSQLPERKKATVKPSA